MLHFPRGLLGHESSEGGADRLSVSVSGDEDNPTGKILAFLTSSWMLILGQSQLRAIRFEATLLRIEMVLHPSWYRPSPEHHTPLGDVKAVRHSNHRDTREKKTVYL